MKKTLFIISAILFVSISAYGQKLVKTYYDPWKETKIKEKYYVNGSNQKNGKYIKYDERGLVGVEINYVNGRPHGIAKEYYLPGYGFPGDEKLKIEANYVNGKKHGIAKQYVYLTNGEEDLSDGKRFLFMQWQYDQDDIVREQRWWYNGNKRYDYYPVNGKSTYWYENGQKQIEFTNKDGLQEGLRTEWYSNGNLMGTISFVKGIVNGEKSYYFESGGKMKTETYVNGKLNGISIEYFENGNKKSECTYQNAILIGDYKEWYDNGTPKFEGQFENGSKNGTWTFYDLKGKPIKGEFKNDIKIGKWRMYFTSDWKETTQIDSAAYYREITYTENGRIDTTQKVIDYYISGVKQFEGYIISVEPDVLNKEFVFYYPNGNPEITGSYENGYKTGIWKEYYENGGIKRIYYWNKSVKQVGYGSIIDNKITGYMFYYDENGVNTKTEYYSNGTVTNTFEGKKSNKIEEKYKDNPNQERLRLF